METTDRDTFGFGGITSFNPTSVDDDDTDTEHMDEASEIKPLGPQETAQFLSNVADQIDESE